MKRVLSMTSFIAASIAVLCRAYAAFRSTRGMDILNSASVRFSDILWVRGMRLADGADHVVDGLHGTAGIAHDDGARCDVLRHDGTSPDERSLTDSDAGQDRDI